MKKNGELTKADLVREIKKQKKNGYKGFLGFVENKKLPDIEHYFYKITSSGIKWYNWVNGNERLKELYDNVKI